jgi:hypothetical protein
VTVDAPPYIALAALDIPALRQHDALFPCVYVFPYLIDRSAKWGGCRIQKRDGDSWETVAVCGEEAYVAGVLSADAEELRVMAYSATPETVSRSKVIRGANRIHVAGSIMSFRSAELLEPEPSWPTTARAFCLRDFLRGLCGSPCVDLAPAGAGGVVVFLGGPRARVDVDSQDLYTPMVLRAVPAQVDDLDDTSPTIEIVPTGANLDRYSRDGRTKLTPFSSRGAQPPQRCEEDLG